MFIRWENRSRPVRKRRQYEASRTDERPSYQTLIARLVESRRIEGVPRQRIIAHLGTCREPVSKCRHRYVFYLACHRQLSRLDLSDVERQRIMSLLARRVPPLTDDELASINGENARWAAAVERNGENALWAAAVERTIDGLRFVRQRAAASEPIG